MFVTLSFNLDLCWADYATLTLAIYGERTGPASVVCWRTSQEGAEDIRNRTAALFAMVIELGEQASYSQVYSLYLNVITGYELLYPNQNLVSS